MPTITENKQKWDGDYPWDFMGDEWSLPWGNSAMQWYCTILPRIHRFLPAGNVLEIACGHGRWTQFLKDRCDKLIAIDLSNECIEACEKRFTGCPNIDFKVNDGKSLEMIPDNSIDFIFSFDSLVHVDISILDAYISQFHRILKKDGACFIHHSNFGDYFHSYSNIRKVPKLEGLLMRLGILEKDTMWRDLGVNAKEVEVMAEKHCLQCISQELINWKTERILIDCFSVIVKKGSLLARDNIIVKNSSFMQEIRNTYQLSSMYS